jgi:hypothetical protein
MRFVLLSALLAFASARAVAQDMPAPRLVARPVATPIALDGRLDDAAWRDAPVATGFTQRRPQAGRPAAQRTEARVLFDAAHLYVALRLLDDAPDSIVGARARRDFGGHSDWAHVLIDGYRDRRTAYRFSVNAAGVIADAMIAGDEEDAEEAGWDAVWDARVARDAEGWSAELRIPLGQLRFTAAGDGPAQWGIQFVRDVARTGERSLWAPANPTEPGWVSRFGTLAGLDLRAARRLETVPYLLGRLQRAPGEAANPFHQPTELSPQAGLDLRWGPTSDLTLAATLNPDFGEVEADPSEVNLSAQETFLAERRPFFLEGADIFQLEMSEAPWMHGSELVFHSRRIGRGVQGSAPGSALWSDADAVSRILGAAKLSGKVRNRWSLALLNATTGEERARYLDEDSARGRATVEPLTNFALARAVRLARDNDLAIGGVLTAVHRRLTNDFRQLPASALVGGVDGRLRFGGGAWDLTGALLGSRLAGDAEAIDAVRRNGVHRHQRPDAEHLDYAPGATSLAGTSAMVNLSKNAGAWRGTLAAHAISPGFDANDMGFHTASDLRRVHGLLGHQRMTPGTFRRWWWWWNSWSAWTGGGEHVQLGSQVNTNFETHAQWLLSSAFRREQAALSTTALRGGPALLTPGRWRMGHTLTSDARRRAGASTNVTLAWGDEGERLRRIAPLVRLRPTAASDVILQATVERFHHPAQWIGRTTYAGEAVHLAGALRQATRALTARLDLAFTRDITLAAYAQAFSSEGRFAAVHRVAAPRAGAFDARYATLADAQVQREGDRLALDLDGDGATDATVANPSFDVKELNANVVLRWQLGAGSALTAVWGHGRSARDTEPAMGEDAWTDARALLRVPATNVLLVKWSRWIGW